MLQETQKRPWFKDYMVWFVIAWPLIAIVAGFYTFYLAYITDDGLVVDDYYKKGKEINHVIARDQAASVYGLTTRIILNEESPSIVLYLTAKSSSFSFPNEIKFSFLHPTQDRLDQHLILKHQSQGTYNSEQTTKPLNDGRWYVYIESDAWRLNTTINMPNTQSFTASAQ